MVTPLLPHRGAMNGGELVKYEQLRLLARRHRITLLSFARPDDAGESDAMAGMRELGVRVVTVPRPLSTGPRRIARQASLAARWLVGSAPLRALAFADPAMQARITSLVTAERFDLLHVWDNAMGAYRYPGDVPAVLTEQEVITPAVGARGLGGLLDRRRWRRHQRAVWRRFDGIEVFTARDASGIRALAPELAGRVTVNPFGIELPAAPSGEPAEPATLVFVGGFLHAPNVDAAQWLASAIMPALWARHPALRLEIVGSYPPRGVRSLASDRIVVTGRVERVEPYLERATVVLAPVRTGGGMRVKVLQAMAMGKAVVTTALGAEGLAPWPAGAAPCVVAAGASAFADATAHLVADPADRQALAVRARAFVAQHHSWDAYASRLDEVHRRALQARGAAREGG